MAEKTSPGPDEPSTPPLIELGAPILGDPEKRAIADVIDDGWLTMGERVRRFELEFATLHGAPDAVAVNSATAALHLSLAAFDISHGDEVLVPSLSFVATAAVVIHQGARPVFVDIESLDRPHIDLRDAERLLTPRTKAAMVMHYGGYAVDMAPWRALANTHGLRLFEDAAHASGLHGIGSNSDAASFSFFSNKNITTGEGGMMIVADDDKRARTRLLRAHGMTASTLDRDRGRAVGYDVVECGHNFRMDEMRAAVGIVQLARLAEWNATRTALIAHYRQLLAEALPEITPVFAPEMATSGHLMSVILPAECDRGKVMASLRQAGIQSSVHYPPIHEFEYYRRAFGRQSLPVSQEFGRRQLTLPLHARLSPADVERVVEQLARVLHG